MCDYNLRLFPAEVFRALQITADEHIDNLGYDGYAMADRGLAWVLIRTEVWMDRYPKYLENFTVYTATSETRHGVYPRYFEIRDEKGEVIGKAMTLWIIFDLNKRAMLAGSEANISVGAAKSRKEVPPFPPSPKPLTEGEKRISKRTVRYTDMDMVGHMNNTHYIDWLTDAMPWQKFKDSEIEHIIIGYTEETRPDTELELELVLDGDRFSFRDVNGPSKHFVLCGEWRSL